MGQSPLKTADDVWGAEEWPQFRVNSLALVPDLEGKVLEEKQKLEGCLREANREWTKKEDIQPMLDDVWSGRVAKIVHLNSRWKSITPQQFVVCVNML